LPEQWHPELSEAVIALLPEGRLTQAFPDALVA
jgi:hypothetical protein